MTMIYSNPARENDEHALPDVEVFYDWPDDAGNGPRNFDGEGNPVVEGWYWWACMPGCLPDGEPNGPFATEAEAIADAQSGNEDDDTPDTNHEHVWGELESSRLAGTVHRKCQVDGCGVVNALDDDEPPADDEPGDDDYYLSSNERCIMYHGRKIAGPVSTDAEPSPQDAVMRELARMMERDQYFPNVWKISGHGNAVLISVQDCGCYFTEHIGEMCDREVKAANEIADSVLPLCVLAMRCYCAGHARGNPASAPCDTNETTTEGVKS